MHIQLDTPDKHSIQRYNDDSITINHQNYDKSVIVSQNEIITDLPFHQVKQISKDNLSLLIGLNPEIIILGHQQSNARISPQIVNELAQHRIGIEIMSLGAACRTYNVLLSELRAVIGVFLISEGKKH